MKIISIVGTRPQFLKVISLHQQLITSNDIDHIVINTGQHFDYNMSDTFFNLFETLTPKYNLSIHSLAHGSMVSQMMISIESILISEQPDKIIVYGDCDSTLAGALVASKMNICLIHMEAGLRSFNKNMPEEINRIVVDHISNILLCPNEYAVKNLNNENIHKNIYIVDNLQINLLFNCLKKNNMASINNNLIPNEYILLTVHRNYNTSAITIAKLFNQLQKNNMTVCFVIHPRMKQIISSINVPKNIIIMEPVNYVDMITLLFNCNCVVTDSGGLQVEAMYLNKKCFTIRSETEWLDTLDYNNCLVNNIDTLYEHLQSFSIKQLCTKSYNQTDWIKLLKNV